MTAVPRVVAFVGPHHDLIHTSRIFTGLSALRRQRAIALEYRVPRGGDGWLIADPIVVCLDVQTTDWRRVALDLRDGPGTSWPIIDRVSRYFKRAYHAPEVSELPPALAAKMAPFGLNYGCRSAASTVDVLTRIAPLLLGQGPAGWQRLRQYIATPGPDSFEQTPEAAVEPKVSFQTRLWTKEEISPDEVDCLNESRVAMVRALRQAFGDRFVGGLVPTPFALERYPEDITPHPSRYAEYLAVKKTCLVSVYTPGVEHSLAFKLGETLAASQCLVSMPLRYELPSPLVAERHYLQVATPEEAVQACARLLSNHDLALAMRRANHEYYVREVEPAAHVARVLARCA
jgi:hypothetical protein